MSLSFVVVRCRSLSLSLPLSLLVVGSRSIRFGGIVVRGVRRGFVVGVVVVVVVVVGGGGGGSGGGGMYDIPRRG